MKLHQIDSNQFGLKGDVNQIWIWYKTVSFCVYIELIYIEQAILDQNLNLLYNKSELGNFLIPQLGNDHIRDV